MPCHDDLPIGQAGGRSAWGLFGSEDNVGLINLLTPERVIAGARLIRTGRTFVLDAPIDAFRTPVDFWRTSPAHRIIHEPGTLVFDDVYDGFYPQGSSQWDALGHVAYDVDAFYNNASEDDIASGRRNTIEHWAKRGIAGRAVVLDMQQTLSECGRSYDPGSDREFSIQDLELAREKAGVSIETGDILILHTGFASWYRDRASEEDLKLSELHSPGLAAGEDMCRYLWDLHVAAIAADNFQVEVRPVRDRSSPTGFLHRTLIGQFGMALGELWWTEELVADCRQDNIYEVFLVSVPMNAPGAIGSPPHAIAIK